MATFPPHQFTLSQHRPFKIPTIEHTHETAPNDEIGLASSVPRQQLIIQFAKDLRQSIRSIICVQSPVVHANSHRHQRKIGVCTPSRGAFIQLGHSPALDHGRKTVAPKEADQHQHQHQVVARLLDRFQDALLVLRSYLQLQPMLSLSWTVIDLAKERLYQLLTPTLKETAESIL